MLIQKEFLSKLKDFGLNTYESKIWSALLSRGISTAGELSDIANVPRSRSYDVLESLEKKGFVIMKLGKPIKYIAISPSEVLDRVKKKIKEEAGLREKQLEELNTSVVLEELNLLYNQGVDLVEPTELAGSIRGRDNIYTQMETMIKNSKKSVFIATSSEGIKRKSTELMRVIKKAKDRGVEIKIAGKITTKNKDAADKLLKVAHTYHDKDSGARFCVVDDKEMLFMLTDDAIVHPFYDVGVWVNSQYFINSMVKAFDVVK
ncbi:MAG: hypothetical protein KKF44_07160 [Nanoarchaeota archaeon]|nr:hypothetical protein [Nanoarchaeota archaeon]